MGEILQDDPTFIPLVTKGSLPAVKNVEAEVEISSSSDEGQVQHSSAPPKKTQINELKEFMAERDARFLKTIEDMNERQNKLMEKIIEKL